MQAHDELLNRYRVAGKANHSGLDYLMNVLGMLLFLAPLIPKASIGVGLFSLVYFFGVWWVM